MSKCHRPATNTVRAGFALFGLLGCLLAAGCGGAPARHDVAGTVYLDGEPVADGSVLFRPAAGGPALFAVTDAAGRYRLQTTDKAGALAGEYEVTVSKERAIAGGTADGSGRAAGLRIEYLLPERYADPKKSGLRVKVPSDKYDLSLTSK